MKAINIQWFIDEENIDKDTLEEIRATLPTEVDLPDDIVDMGEDKDDIDEDAISEYLSDLTGYLHSGYELV